MRKITLTDGNVHRTRMRMGDLVDKINEGRMFNLTVVLNHMSDGSLEEKPVWLSPRHVLMVEETS